MSDFEFRAGFESLIKKCKHWQSIKNGEFFFSNNTFFLSDINFVKIKNMNLKFDKAWSRIILYKNSLLSYYFIFD